VGARVGRYAPSFRHRRAAAGAVAFCLVVLCAGFVVGTSGSAAPKTHADHAGRSPATARLADNPGNGSLKQLGATASLTLAPATAPPTAAPASLTDQPPLAAREDFAFAPSWTLAQSPTFDITGLSTLAYFSIDVNGNGTLEESGPGWNGFQSQDLADLISRAHAGGARVVLRVTDFGQSSLDAPLSSATAPATLSGTLIPLLQAKSLDGVNFDFEGEGSADQSGLTDLITSVAGSLRGADPHWQITMDTYASSAGDSGGFYDIPALTPAVDAFIVMDYELNLAGAASAGRRLRPGQRRPRPRRPPPRARRLAWGPGRGGGRPQVPQRPGQRRPTTTTTVASITGAYNGSTVDLTPIAASGVPGLVGAGTLSDFQTNVAAYACLDGL
jgi:Glycosyl hydrolases family 18